MKTSTEVKPFTLTLSKWHHVATRLKELSNRSFNDALFVLNGKAFSNKLTDEQKAILIRNGQNAQKDLDYAMRASLAAGRVRAKLASENGRLGVSEMLAQADMCRAQIRMLNSLDKLDLTTMVTPDQANDALKDKQMASNSFNNATVQVSAVSLDALEFVRKSRRNLEVTVSVLNDSIAKLNQNEVTIELEVEFAKDIGLLGDDQFNSG